MKRRSVARAALAATGALALAAGTAGAHPSDMLIDDGFLNSALDEHQTYGHGAEGSVPGRKELPSGPKELGLKLIGKTINAPEFGDLGRIADVSAKGNYAYLTMFYEPQCGRGGVQIVEHSNPANPVKRGYIPSHVDTFSGEGSQVVTMDSPSFKGDLLVFQNESCPQTTNGVGGISLVDVGDPDRPKKLVEGAGDFTKKSGEQSNGVPQTKANQTHSAFAWKSQGDGRWYVVLVDDMEEPDVDILDITNPSKPKLVAEWNLDTTAQDGPGRPHGDSVFSHDMVVKKIGGKDVMLMSYWDGGYVHLDVTDPTVQAPKIMADTDFAATDPANSSGFTPRATPIRRSSRATTSSSSPPTRTSIRSACRPPSPAARTLEPSSRPSRRGTRRRSIPRRQWSGRRSSSVSPARRSGRRRGEDRRDRTRCLRLPGQG